MKMQSLVNLSEYTTFRLGPQARWFSVFKTLEELHDGFAFAKEHDLPVLILGSGSNTIMKTSNVFEAVVLKNEMIGFNVIEETNEHVVIKIGAGEIWDSVVSSAVSMGFSGIEAMSWIPGTVGATPIQNVGAYGTEIADVLVSLEAYDVATGELRSFAKKECEFEYRDSIFKHELKDKYVITSIIIKLSKSFANVPDYPGVKKYFEDKNITNPNLLDIRNAIIDIRNIKLPDPKKIASVGSFFKNPIVKKTHLVILKEKYPSLIAFSLDNENFKIGAGWLLETLGFKGKQFGNLAFYENNALVMINSGNATFEELDALVQEVKAKVKKEFNIELEMEPVVI